MVINHDKTKTESIIDFSKGYVKGSILDVGCNEAQLYYYLNKTQKKNYQGLDYDKDVISKLKSKNIKAKQVNLNSKKLPFKSNSKDTILVLDVLEHLIEPEKTIVEVKRILKKSGYAIFSIPYDYSFFNFVRMFVLAKPILVESATLKKGTHIHFFTLEMSKRLISSQFKIKKVGYMANYMSVPFLLQKNKDKLARFWPRMFACNIFIIAQKE